MNCDVCSGIISSLGCFKVLVIYSQLKAWRLRAIPVDNYHWISLKLQKA